MTDPLRVDIELEGVDASLPLVPEQDVPVQISEATVDPNKNKTGHNLNLTLKTTTPLTSPDGREIKVGFPLFTTYGLQPAEDSKDPEGFRRNISGMVDAIFRTSKENRPRLTPELIASMVGKEVIAHVVIDSSYDGVPRNKVRRLKASG